METESSFMFFSHFETWILPVVWSLASVGIGLICGFLAGVVYAKHNQPRRLKRDRERALSALMHIISSTNQLNSDVHDHNNALQHAETEIQQVDSKLEIDELQSSLIQNVRQIVNANQKMENDLVVSQFQLEATAQELDRSRKEARTDSLCNVANRKAVDETLNFMVSRFRSRGRPFGLMLIDIDHFKRINDTFGHESGDAVLISVGNALQECVRPEDFVGRLGGDEFVVMIEGLTRKNADMVGQRIRSTIELYNFSVGTSGESTVVTLSMGLAVVQDGDDGKSLYRRADQALYRSKEMGRNQLCTILQEGNGDPANSVSNNDTSRSYAEFKATLESGYE